MFDAEFDISFCSNEDCPKKKKCKRGLCNYGTLSWVSVSKFEHENCEHFMDRETKPIKRKKK